eukprot:1195990-Prorocentrum_minimum.AAC.4
MKNTCGKDLEFEREALEHNSKIPIEKTGSMSVSSLGGLLEERARPAFSSSSARRSMETKSCSADGDRLIGWLRWRKRTSPQRHWWSSSATRLAKHRSLS